MILTINNKPKEKRFQGKIQYMVYLNRYCYNMCINMKGEPRERDEEITSKDIYNTIDTIPSSEWRDAGYPVISYVKRGIYQQYIENIDSPTPFWQEVLNSEHFINYQKSREYDPNIHILFVLHSFPNRDGEDVIFKAITTTDRSFVENPEHMINYRYHGKPCELRSKTEYPTLNNFWSDFYDKLSYEEQDKYVIPDRNWRKHNLP